MRGASENLVSQILDEALLRYTEKRFISDDEIADLKFEVTEAVRKLLVHDHLDRTTNLITLAFEIVA